MSNIEIGDLYKKAQGDVEYQGDKGWETIKFCVTISSTLITATVGLLTVINYLPINVVIKPVLMLLLVPIMVIMERIVKVTKKNFNRECRRMYENITILMKIEDELPQRKDFKANRNFKEEKEYIPQDWKKMQYSNTDEYVKSWMGDKKRPTFYSSMSPIFSLFQVISYVITIGVIIITVLTIMTSLKIL
jgi:hypothetical protein